jgi:hypothetical protein
MSTPLSKRYYGAHPIKHFCSGHFAHRKYQKAIDGGSVLSVNGGTGLPVGAFFVRQPGVITDTLP